MEVARSTDATLSLKIKDGEPMLQPETSHSHALSIEELLDQLEVDPNQGLSSLDHAERLKAFGLNEFETLVKASWYKVMLKQLKSAVIWVLLAAAFASLIFGDWVDSLAIAVVVLINTLIGFSMEWQAEKSMEALRGLAKTKCRVLRNGQVILSLTEQLVPGDIVVLEPGDIVAADCRLLDSHNLSVKESALTGESMDMEKRVGIIAHETVLADRTNMVYKGTVVVRGHAQAAVIATGRNTELGKISKLVSEAEKSITPFEKKLSGLSKKLIYLTLLITIAIVLIGLIKQNEFQLLLETAIALAVAAIPEGLPIVATIALARGMTRMSRQQVIVKNLQAVQTLGEVNVLCTDKTGTLTEDRMNAMRIALPSGDLKVNEINEISPELTEILTTAVLCNNASYDPKDPENSSGDSLEVALLKLSHNQIFKHNNLNNNFELIQEIPFDSEKKYMAVLHRSEKGLRASVKGAVEVVLERCTRYRKNGIINTFEDKDLWKQKVDEFAQKGLRVLAFAYDDDPDKHFDQNLIFQGIIAFLDPPRSDVRRSIDTCQHAGIKVVMVTGDHPETSRNISQQTGISEDHETLVYHGSELENLSGNPEILNADVFARVTPAQKLELVKAYQKSGSVVAMTGDGVNDAPALQKSDVGIAMGIRGTEAAREASDIVLKDDALSSIVKAVKEGRIIFGNIRNFVIYLLSCNISEIMLVGIATLAGLPMPLLPLQILFLNIVTDVFPALALGMGEGAQDVMHKKARRGSEPILLRKHWTAVLSYGLAITVALLALLFYARYRLELDDKTFNNLVFYTLIMAQLWNVFNLPKRYSSFFQNEVSKNWYVWGAILLCILLVIIAYLIPVVKEALSLGAFPFHLIGLMFLFSLLPVLLIQILKRGIKIIA